MESTVGQIIAGILIVASFVGFILYRHRQDLKAEQQAKRRTTPAGRV